MDNDTLFIVTPLLLPFLTITASLYLRQTCRTTCRAMRDIRIHGDPNKDWNGFLRLVPPSARTLDDYIKYIHPTVFVQNLFDISWDEDGECCRDPSSAFQDLLRSYREPVPGITDSASPRAIAYFASIWDAADDYDFTGFLDYSGINLRFDYPNVFTAILRSCRPRSLDILFRGDLEPIPPLPILDIMCNRFNFANCFEDDLLGMYKAIQQRLTDRINDDITSVTKHPLSWNPNPYWLKGTYAYAYISPDQLNLVTILLVEHARVKSW